MDICISKVEDLDDLRVEVSCLGCATTEKFDGGIWEEYSMIVFYGKDSVAAYHNSGESSQGISGGLRERATRNLEDLKKGWKARLDRGELIEIDPHNLINQLRSF